MQDWNALKYFLDKKVDEFHQPFFIEQDPISVPHRFNKLQDIEIAGFFAAIFAWGNRKTIIQKTNQLLALMDDAPYDFMLNHQTSDLEAMVHFKHRTFQTMDLMYFIEFFQHHYREHASLETAFQPEGIPLTMEERLNHFYHYFFSLDHVPARTRKHIAAPFKGAACKRINMFLRWMVRSNKGGVDFGLWKTIKPSQLIIPLDLHVSNVANRLSLIDTTKSNWTTAKLLTEALRKFDKTDPVKYDYALFGLGVLEGFR